MADRRDPRTQVRPPPPPGGPGRGTDSFAGLARPLLAFAAEAARQPRPDPAALAAQARRLAEGFEAAALRAGNPRADVGEARDALLAVLESRMRGNPALSSAAWARARRKALPGVPEPDPAELGRRRAAAEAGGAARRNLARFLGHCAEAVAAAPPAHEPAGHRWGLIAPVALVLALAGWAGYAEWRYASALLAAMPSQESLLAAAAADPVAAAERLTELKASVEEIAARAYDSPLALAPHLGRVGPVAVARRRYVAAVDALVPGPLGAAIGVALANEGGSLALYDTLRTLAILRGEAPWQPGFVAGWVEARGAADPALAAFAEHAGALSGPPPGLPPQDPELLGQARGIAAEGDPAAFAFLELARDDDARALPAWSPAAVPELAGVMVRRSGQPLLDAIPGLFTAEGWAYARDVGAQAAIGRATALHQRTVGSPAGAAVSEDALLAVLQARTIEAWSEELADLRVRPFTDRRSALMVSGTLGRPSSPLSGLFQAVWHQVGGDDRSRSYQDLMSATLAFGPTVQFVQEGRMAEIEQVFAGLNVALQATGSDAEISRRRLMDAQHRAASIATLNQAPRLVVQTIEDVLSQTGTSREETGRPRAALNWQREVAAACRTALTHRYPFAPGGTDADLAAVAAFLGPEGALPRFVASNLKEVIDTSTNPWSWKPDARLAGFSPDSAAFLGKATAVGDALFPPEGVVSLTFATLARQGATSVSLGGVVAPIDAAGTPVGLAWPGPRPGAGLAVEAEASGPAARQAWEGAWGLLRFLDGLHVRARDDGRRFLLDVRLSGSRAFLELTFPRQANPAAARSLMAGLECPPTL